MSRRHARAAALALALDRAVTHPDRVPHPVALFGRAMSRVEARTYADDHRAGAAYATTGVAVAAAAGMLARSTVAATWVSLGGRQLHDVASGIGALLREGDIAAARTALPALVGRDPDALDAGGIARAVVESVAENTVDAVVAPALWAAVAGAPGVLVHRAVDTMDSMVGHRSDRYARFGTASARLDDAMAWAPARATVALVCLARPEQSRRVLRTVRRDAGSHPSPNAGVAEAAFAAALGVRLGGTTVYADRTERRPELGDGRDATTVDIDRAVGLSREVTTLLAVLLLGLGVGRGRGRR